MAPAPCRLLSLPPELRNKIYCHTLVHPTPIQISSRSNSPTEAAQGATTHYPDLIEPAFLSTCRQIRHEALPIFYGDNVFFTAIKDALAPWLQAIGPGKASMLRNVWGFRPSRYFEFGWARGLCVAVERELEKDGMGLKDGVFRMPFGVEEFPGKVFWVSTTSSDVFVTEEGVIEHARGVCEIELEDDELVRVVPGRLTGV